jgi:hypothetical protein
MELFRYMIVFAYAASSVVVLLFTFSTLRKYKLRRSKNLGEVIDKSVAPSEQMGAAPPLISDGQGAPAIMRALIDKMTLQSEGVASTDLERTHAAQDLISFGRFIPSKVYSAYSEDTFQSIESGENDLTVFGAKSEAQALSRIIPTSSSYETKENMTLTPVGKTLTSTMTIFCLSLLER